MPATPIVEHVVHSPTSRWIPAECEHYERTINDPVSSYTIPLTCRKRVFLLGPSHHVYLPGCALSSTTHYETPLYNLEIDKISELLLYECAVIIFRFSSTFSVESAIQ